MERYKPTATLFLDTRKAKVNGKYPLKLTVYCKPDKKRYGLNIELTRAEWERINTPKLKDENLKETRLKAKATLLRAAKILEGLAPFSFHAFEEQFYKAAVGKQDLSLKRWFNEYLQELDEQERVGTRISYNTTFNSLNNYRPNLKLTHITIAFLESYEAHMKKLGKSPSTVGIYLRQLRAIINRAIKAKVLKREDYPFQDYEIPGSRNVKKALSDVQLQGVLTYAPTNQRHEKALDFWTLSYLCNGMNITDILHLSPESLNGNFLYFVRQKTKRTRKKDVRPIKVPLHPRAKAIIEKWKNTDGNAPYLFPVLEAELSAKTIKYRTQGFIKGVNEAMDEIRQELKIEQKVGTYVARHSFSSRLMRKNAPIAFIRESLGHSSVATTENYLGDFEDSVKLEYANLLTD